MIPDSYQAYKRCLASGRAAEVIERRTVINKANNSVLACGVKVECSSGLGIFKRILQSSATSIPLFKLEDQERMQGWRLAVVREQMIPDGYQAYKQCSASGRAAEVIVRCHDEQSQPFCA